MRYDEERVQRLERLVEELHQRVARLEREASPAAPPRAARPSPTPPPRAPEPPSPPRTPATVSVRPSIDLEQLLGGRVLAWAGAVAVFLGLVFFVATAIRRGWIDEPTRIALAYLGSTVLLAAGLYLFERRGRTQAALAAVAAAIGALYASTTAATTLYGLVDPAVGLGVAALTGAVATGLAVRWGSREVGAVGILGALLSPVLVDAGTTGVALAFMALALAAAAGVVVWQRWDWLAIAAFAISVPQLAAWLLETYDDSPGLALLVLGAFWAIWVVAAVGFELRVPTERLRLSSGSLLLAAAVVTAGAGWLVLENTGRSDAATGWVIGAALVHVALGASTFRGRISREVALLLLAVGIGLSAIGAALALDGPALVAAWSVEAVLLAWLAGRTGTPRGYVVAAGFLAAAAAHALALDAPPDRLVGDPAASSIVALVLVAAAAAAAGRLYRGAHEEARVAADLVAVASLAYLVPIALDGLAVVAGWALLAAAAAVLSHRSLLDDLGLAAAGLTGLAAAHVLGVEAPPISLRDGVDDLALATAGIALVTAAAIAGARYGRGDVARLLAVAGAVGAVYLPSVAIVDLTATGELEGGQTPQVLLSAFWSAVGVAALVVGLRRDARRLRVGGLVLLGVAAAKVVAYDLAELDEIYRVLSFVALGLLLLAGGYAYQRAQAGGEGS